MPHLVGVYVVPELIGQAKVPGGGHFKIASYEDIAAGADVFVVHSHSIILCGYSGVG